MITREASISITLMSTWTNFNPNGYTRLAVLLKNSRFLINFCIAMNFQQSQLFYKKCTFTVSSNETIFVLQIQDKFTASNDTIYNKSYNLLFQNHVARFISDFFFNPNKMSRRPQYLVNLSYNKNKWSGDRMDKFLFPYEGRGPYLMRARQGSVTKLG